MNFENKIGKIVLGKIIETCSTCGIAIAKLTGKRCTVPNWHCTISHTRGNRRHALVPLHPKELHLHVTSKLNILLDTNLINLQTVHQHLFSSSAYAKNWCYPRYTEIDVFSFPSTGIISPGIFFCLWPRSSCSIWFGNLFPDSRNCTPVSGWRPILSHIPFKFIHAANHTS